MATAELTQPKSTQADPDAMRRRALATWPRLDQAALRRCGDDIECVASMVERRSALPRASILGILAIPIVSEDERATWFG